MPTGGGRKGENPSASVEFILFLAESTSCNTGGCCIRESERTRGEGEKRKGGEKKLPYSPFSGPSFDYAVDGVELRPRHRLSTVKVMKEKGEKKGKEKESFCSKR